MHVSGRFIGPLVSVVFLILVATECSAAAQTSVTECNPGTEGPGRDKLGVVFTSALMSDHRVVVGGKFIKLGGFSRQNLGRLEPTGVLDNGFGGSADDVVCVLVPQLDGGLLVGGMFRQLSGTPQPYLGRLLPDGSRDATFKGGADYHVYAIAPSPDGGIYVGGAFRELAGQARAFLGRLDAAGNLDGTFSVELDGPVHTVAVQPDGAVIVGGRFHSANGKSRRGLARVLASGQLDPAFEPATDGPVNCVLLQPDGRILIAGHFTQVAGQSADRVARLQPDGRFDDSFAGSVTGGSNPHVQSLALCADGRIVLGGQFERLGGEPRLNLGLLLADGRVDPAFAADANVQLRQTSVNSVSITEDGGIFVGGSFTNIAGIERRGLARLAVDRPAINSLEQVGSQIEWKLEGSAPAVAEVVFEWTRDGQDWKPVTPGLAASTNRSVPLAAIPTGATLRARGIAHGGARCGSAALLTAGFGPPVLVAHPVDCSTDFRASAQMRAVVEGSPSIRFQWLHNGEPVSDSSSVRGTQNPTLELGQLPISATGDFALHVWNDFGSVTSRLARLVVRDPVVSTRTNELTANAGEPTRLQITADGTPPISYAWKKDGAVVPGAVGSCLTISNVSLFDQGTYQATVQNGSGAMAMSAAIELQVNAVVADSFDPRSDGQVMSIATAPDGGLYVGGSFSNIGGGERKNIARLDSRGRLDPAFLLNADDNVLVIHPEPAGEILVGGNFTTLGGESRSRLARVLADGSLDPMFDPNVNDTVLCSALQADGRWLVGGLFTEIGGRPATRIARLQSDGSPDSSFRAGASFAVRALVGQPGGGILVGGQFRELSGNPCEWLGRLRPDGSFDASFQARINGPVAALAVQPDGRIVIGGEFNRVDGVVRRSLARLQVDGRLDTDFQADADGPIVALRLTAEGGILVGGAFGRLNAYPRRNVGLIRPDGTLSPHFCPSVDDWVRAIQLESDGSLIIAGSFKEVGDIPRRGLARLR